MKKIKAVIFDMDGVIVDSEPLHERAFLELFDEIGIGMNHGIDFKAYYGKSDRALLEDLISLHRPKHSLDSLLARKRQKLINLIQQEKPLFPEVKILLEHLKGKKLLGLASGSPPEVIDTVLNLDGLHKYFDAIVSVEDVGKPKPAPDVFLEAAKRLRVKPEECIIIEDSVAGIEAAKRAGILVIAITNSLPYDDLRSADYIVNDYSEIKEIISDIENKETFAIKR
jgi:beta-phosphoglucomutase family hydrolase